MSCPTNHRNIDRRRFDGGHTYCYDCKQHVEVAHVHYANGERPPVQAARILAKLNTEQPLPPHQFVTVVVLPNTRDDGTDDAWEWCPRCGVLRLGVDFFEPGKVHVLERGTMICANEPPPCVPR